MALSLNLLAAGASAQTLWVYGTALQKSNVEGELAFAVMVDKSGYYEAALEVQGESAQDYTVVLELQAEREGTPVTTRFSFAGLDCG